jgi:hypothetical protein
MSTCAQKFGVLIFALTLAGGLLVCRNAEPDLDFYERKEDRCEDSAYIAALLSAPQDGQISVHDAFGPLLLYGVCENTGVEE